MPFFLSQSLPVRLNQGCIKANRINPGAVIARLEVGYAGVEVCAAGLVDAVCGGLVGECTTDSRVLAVCALNELSNSCW